MGLGAYFGESISYIYTIRKMMAPLCQDPKGSSIRMAPLCHDLVDESTTPHRIRENLSLGLMGASAATRLPPSPGRAPSASMILLPLLYLTLTNPRARAQSTGGGGSQIAPHPPPSLSEQGFDYSWYASSGWFFLPPGSGGSERMTLNVLSVDFCASLCSFTTADDGSIFEGGEYDTDSGSCWCYDTLVCLEGCAGLNNRTVEFSRTRPPEDFDLCDRSFCDYYGETYGEYCADEGNGYDADDCAAKIEASGAMATVTATTTTTTTTSTTTTTTSSTTTSSTAIILPAPPSPDLSQFGYDQSWPASEGWFVIPPGSSAPDAVHTKSVATPEECARICSETSAEGGEYDNGGGGSCNCYARLECLEPCAGIQAEDRGGGGWGGETGRRGRIEFASRPRESFEVCPRSFCDEEYYYEDYVDYCNDPGTGYDGVKCAAKIAELASASASETASNGDGGDAVCAACGNGSICAHGPFSPPPLNGGVPPFDFPYPPGERPAFLDPYELEGDIHCVCPQGFVGKHCDRAYEICGVGNGDGSGGGGMPCFHGGECTEDVGVGQVPTAYSCDCSGAIGSLDGTNSVTFSGTYCQDFTYDAVTAVCVKKDGSGADLTRWECINGGTCSIDIR